MQAQFEVVRLNRWSAKAWGVVDDAGELVGDAVESRRMKRGEAFDLARALNAAGRPKRGARCGRPGATVEAPMVC
ncbi:hypothetical protein ACFSCV_06215 [Methylopila henanensis]|uniref:Uncharacterized protein n=1 Tax=Methylopila henanensis TaxID=873516 RepID=A0ABW4K7D8_9HYPH